MPSCSGVAFQHCLGCFLSWVTLSNLCHPVLTAVELRGCCRKGVCVGGLLLFLGYSKSGHQTPGAYLQAAWPLSNPLGCPCALHCREGCPGKAAIRVRGNGEKLSEKSALCDLKAGQVGRLTLEELGAKSLAVGPKPHKTQASL